MDRQWGRPFFSVVVVAYVVALVTAALVMPDPTPSHYDGLGRPDDWSSRTGMVAFWAIIGVVILAGGWGLSRIRTKEPTLVNLPARSKEYWFANDERRERFWDMFADNILTLIAWTGLLLVTVMLGSAFSARAGANVPLLVLYGSLAVYLAATTWSCLSLLRRTRPPRT